MARKEDSRYGGPTLKKKKDTEPLYHSFMHSLVSLPSSIYVTSSSVFHTEVTVSISLKVLVLILQKWQILSFLDTLAPFLSQL